MITTTLGLLRSAGACKARYAHLCKALGGVKVWGRDTPIPLTRILDSNGLDDTLWALSAVPEHEWTMRDRLARIFACDCADRVLLIFEQVVPGDSRPRNAITVARKFAAGAATEAEMATAGAAAGAAAWAAAGAAVRATAWAAAGAADRATAGAAERAWQATRLRALLSETDTAVQP
jgi:hypothetical protein